MKIGILQTGRSPEALRGEHGDYDALFRQLLADQGFTFETYPVLDMVLPGSIDAADGWLITGSRHGAYEDHPWIPPLEAFIRDAQGAGIPIVGICFGHQIVAQALGGRVEKFTGGWTCGRQVYQFEGLGPLAVNAFHQDQVTRKPDAARVIATTPSCAFAGLEYDGPILTIQPHPEMGHDFFAALLDARAEILPDAVVDAARALADQPLDNGRIAAMIADFFKAHAGGAMDTDSHADR